MLSHYGDYEHTRPHHYDHVYETEHYAPVDHHQYYETAHHVPHHGDYYREEVWDPERYAAHPSHLSYEDNAYHEAYLPGRSEHQYDDRRRDHYNSNDGPGDNYSEHRYDDRRRDHYNYAEHRYDDRRHDHYN